MDLTSATLQDTVLTQHVILSGDRREFEEKIYYFLERKQNLLINKAFRSKNW